MAEAILGAATISTSFAVWYVLSAEGAASAFAPDELQALADRLLDVRTAGLDVVLLLVGIGATIFCYLLFNARYIPRLLARRRAPGCPAGRAQ